MGQTKAKGAKEHEDQDERIIVSIRNVSKRRWAAVQEKANREGRLLRAILDEMMDDFLKK